MCKNDTHECAQAYKHTYTHATLLIFIYTYIYLNEMKRNEY